MGYRAICRKRDCKWRSGDGYVTETEAEVAGKKHENEEHYGEECTKVKHIPVTHG